VYKPLIQPQSPSRYREYSGKQTSVGRVKKYLVFGPRIGAKGKIILCLVFEQFLNDLLRLALIDRVSGRFCHHSFTK
jgi:hypothetical protein